MSSDPLHRRDLRPVKHSKTSQEDSAAKEMYFAIETHKGSSLLSRPFLRDTQQALKLRMIKRLMPSTPPPLAGALIPIIPPGVHSLAPSQRPPRVHLLRGAVPPAGAVTR